MRHFGNSLALAQTTTFSVTGGGNLIIGIPLLNVNDNPGNATTLAGLNTGNAATLIKTGSGDLVLTASNIYTGATIDLRRHLATRQRREQRRAADPAAAITDNGTLVFDNTGTTTQGVQFTSAGITGSGSLVQAGAGLLVLNASNGFSGGVVRQRRHRAIGTPAPSARASPGCQRWSSRSGRNNLTVAGLSGSAGTVTTSVPGSLALTVNQTAATSFGGTIQNGAGVLSLAFSGGALDLSGTNTYSGGTTITAGTLQVGSTAALPGTGLLTINSGGLLDLHGFSPIAGQLGGAGTVDNLALSTTSTLTRQQRQRHQHLLRDDSKHGRDRVPREGGHGHAVPHRKQQLFRHHRRQRRHAGVHPALRPV